VRISRGLDLLIVSHADSGGKRAFLAIERRSTSRVEVVRRTACDLLPRSGRRPR
jgi:hypothetical protein